MRLASLLFFLSLSVVASGCPQSEPDRVAKLRAKREAKKAARKAQREARVRRATTTGRPSSARPTPTWPHYRWS